MIEGRNCTERPEFKNFGVKNLHKYLWRYICFLLWTTVSSLKPFDGLVTAVATVFLTAITALLAVVAYWQYQELHRTDRTLQDTMVASTRAWIVPIGAKFDGRILLDHNQRIKISFENIGKEAAWDVVHLGGQGPLFKVIIDGKQMPYIDIMTNPWPINTLCEGNPNRYLNRRTVYPSSKNEVISYVFNSPFVTQDFIDKRESFAFVGCFLYRTPIEPNKIRHSPYCFYFQPKREGTIEDGTFEFCPSGSANAD